MEDWDVLGHDTNYYVDGLQFELEKDSPMAWERDSSSAVWNDPFWHIVTSSIDTAKLCGISLIPRPESVGTRLMYM